MMQSTFKDVIATLQAVTGQSTTTIVTKADTNDDGAGLNLRTAIYTLK